jgi:D-glycero-alpha-D-manno-heptose 1-phosphate guanylyltransferase
MIKEAVILAGGLGTRLQTVVADRPKAMALINGKPFLDYQLDYLDRMGVEHVVLSVGYKRELIMGHYGHTYKNIRINYAVEKEPMGTGGGVKLAMQKVEGASAFVMNGDTLFRINYHKFLNIHRSKNSKLSIVLREVDDVSRYGCIEIDDDGRITGFTEKGSASGPGLINGGVYLINKAFFESFHLPGKFSIEKDLFEKYYQQYPFYGILCRQYFIDIGIPEDFAKAQDDFKEFEHL